MSVQRRGYPRFDSSLRRLSITFPEALPDALNRMGRLLRGLVALALAVLWWGHAGSALAQATAPVEAKPADAPTAPATVPASGTPANLVLDLPSAWDAAEPWRTDRFYFQFAYYTLHFHYDPDHQQSYLFDAEYHFKETWLGGQWIAGMALFQNSFGQFSQYIFGGLVWRPIEDLQPFYVKVTAGPLHGYSGQYRDKVPFNSSGVAPAIIPGIGYCVQRRYCGEFVLLGTNAALFTVGVTVP